MLHTKQWNSWIISLFSIGLILLSSVCSSFALSTTKAKLNYIALGDSLTAGLGSSEVKYLRMNAFVPRLTTALRKNYQVQVENHGIPGLTTDQLLQYIHQGPGVNNSIKKANVITISIGGNDLLRLVQMKELQPKTITNTIEVYGQQMQTMVASIRKLNPHARMYIMGLYSPYPKTHELYQLGQETVQLFNEELQKRTQVSPNVYPIFVHTYFHGKEKQLTHISKKDIHPNDQGYQVIYQSFLRTIEKTYPKR